MLLTPEGGDGATVMALMAYQVPFDVSCLTAVSHAAGATRQRCRLQSGRYWSRDMRCRGKWGAAGKGSEQ